MGDKSPKNVQKQQKAQDKKKDDKKKQPATPSIKK